MRTIRERSARGPRTRRVRGRKRGFSLIEVMTSATILLLGIAGTLTGITSALNLYRHDRQMTQALQIAEGVMEELLLRYQSSPSLEPGTHTGRAYTDSGSPVASGGFYQTSWTITENVPVDGLRQIEVKVTWTDALRPVTLSTYRQ